MNSYTIRYEPVKRSKSKTFICTVCGKRGRKSKTFQQTINPFNKNTVGEQKTVREIESELLSAAERWTPEPVHDKCRGGN